MSDTKPTLSQFNELVQAAALHPARVYLSPSDKVWLEGIARRLQKRINSNDALLAAQLAEISTIANA
jgi:hypothetical protein